MAYIKIGLGASSDRIRFDSDTDLLEVAQRINSEFAQGGSAWVLSTNAGVERYVRIPVSTPVSFVFDGPVPSNFTHWVYGDSDANDSFGD